MLKWWQKSIIYQIYTKSFSDTTGNGIGDLNGVIKNLDYLENLGIGAIWLTPIYPSPMIDNGYDISDYSNIDPLYGDMKIFENLVSEAKKRNIRIVMDLVYNHTSNLHKWFIESKKDKFNSKSDWYIWRDAKSDGSAPTNWRSIFGGSAWTWRDERKQYYLHTFASQQPDLNWENPKVRKALYDSANFWLSKGIGGFRIDAITYIKKPDDFKDGEPDGKDGMSTIHLMTANTKGILDFLREFKHEVFEGHDIFTVGEASGVSAGELKEWVGENGVFDMIFEFSHTTLPFKNDNEIWCYPNKWNLTDLKTAITNSQNSTKDNGWYPIFFENHDQPRSINHFFPEGSDPKKAAKAMAVLLLTLRGTPFIYQGQELGLTNAKFNSIDDFDDISTHGQYNFAIKEGFSPEQALKFVSFFSRDNARTPMQWNSKENAGFTNENSKPWLPVHDDYKIINAESENKDPDSVLNWYKKLIEFRKNHEVLIEGSYEELFSDNEQVFVFSRSNENNKIIIAINFSLNDFKLPDDFIINKTLILSTEKNSVKSLLHPLEAHIYKEN